MSHVVFFFSRAPDLIPYPSLGPHAPLRRGLVFVQASVFSWAAWGAGGRGRGGPVRGPGKVGRYGLDREGLLGKCTVMYAKGCQTLGLVKSRARLAPLRGIKKPRRKKKETRLPGKAWLASAGLYGAIGAPMGHVVGPKRGRLGPRAGGKVRFVVLTPARSKTTGKLPAYARIIIGSDRLYLPA